MTAPAAWYGSPRWRPAALSVAAGLLFFLLGATLVSGPGANPDESLAPGAAASAIMPFPDTTLLAALHAMYDVYNRALIEPPQRWVFQAFGVSIEAARLTSLLFGAAAAAMLTLFAQQRYGFAWASVLALIVATSPGLILSCSFDTGSNAGAFLCEAALVFCAGAAAASRNRRVVWLFAAGAAAGVGIANKLNFIWIVLPLPPAALLAGAWELEGRRLRFWDWTAFAAGAACGFAPVAHQGAAGIIEAFRRPPPYTESLGAHLSEFGIWVYARGRMAAEALSGTGAYYAVSGRPAPFPVGFLLIVLSFPASWIFRKRGARISELWESVFWLTVAVVAFAIACAAPMPVKWHHFPLLAIPALMTALTFASTLVGSRPGRRASVGVLTFGAVVAAVNIVFISEFRAAAASSGGSSQFQSAGRNLARWALEYSVRHRGAMFVCDDWLGPPLYVQSGGKAVLATVGFAAGGPRGEAGAIDALQDGRLVWLRRSPLSADLDLHSLGHDEATLALEREIPDVVVAEFDDNSGRPWAVAERAAPGTRAELEAAWRRAFRIGGDGRLVARPPTVVSSKLTRARPIEWVPIPGGTYMMGGDHLGPNSEPAHPVSVASFEIAKSPVTAGQFDACVRAGACQKPQCSVPDSRDPVACVTWEQADRFSAWVGARLPSEAEWEYAARGGGADQNYPWGSGSCARKEGVGCSLSPRPVCAEAAGDSPQGVCDMIGDRWEWVADVYHESFVGAPQDGAAWETSRPAPWLTSPADLPYVARTARSAFRTYLRGEEWSPYVGFRPVRRSP